jgi:hypothetical protein
MKFLQDEDFAQMYVQERAKIELANTIISAQKKEKSETSGFDSGLPGSSKVRSARLKMLKFIPNLTDNH